MYTTLTLTKDIGLVNWSAEKFRGMRPEVRYKAGETVQLRIDRTREGTVYTCFHIGDDGSVYTNTRLSNGSGIFQNFNSRQFHAMVMQDLCYVI